VLISGNFCVPNPNGEVDELCWVLFSGFPKVNGADCEKDGWLGMGSFCPNPPNPLLPEEPKLKPLAAGFASGLSSGFDANGFDAVEDPVKGAPKVKGVEELPLAAP
jgi:hypothetical protein